MDNLVVEFLRERTLSIDMELNEPLYNTIYYLEKSDEIANRLCHENQQDLIEYVPWSSMHDMYKRNYEYCCGALGCFLIAQFPSSEALCRTAIEGAVNLFYVSLGDSMDKQIAYFKNYLETERKQNKNWRKSVEESDYSVSAKKQHFEKTSQKDEVLDFCENTLRQSLSLAEVDYDSSNLKWPSIFDRFREINDEVGYRTIYVALCSQAHNDAEDVLNRIMSRVLENVVGLDEAQTVEQYLFSLFMVMNAIKYHINASAMYIAKFEINVSELIELLKEILQAMWLLTEIMPESISEKINFG